MQVSTAGSTHMCRAIFICVVEETAYLAARMAPSDSDHSETCLPSPLNLQCPSTEDRAYLAGKKLEMGQHKGRTAGRYSS